jgi:hypothetical protein
MAAGNGALGTLNAYTRMKAPLTKHQEFRSERA